MRHSFILTLIIYLCAFQASLACVCVPMPKLDSLSQLSSYKFIAHVVITDDDDIATADFRQTGTLKFKIITLFKGSPVNQLLEYEKNSSCDIGISKGEEWILFGVLSDNKLSIRACDRNVRYSDASGEKDWEYKGGIEELETLNRLYKRPVKVYPDGVYISKYKNGHKELEETYLDNKLHGLRKVWYPDGQLRATEHYTHGLADGKSEWFYPSGQLERADYFKEGKNYNVSRTYYDTAINSAWKSLLIKDFYKTEDSLNADYKRIQVQYERVYNAIGEMVLFRTYYRNGQIQQEEFYGRKNEHGVTIDYYNNGLIRYISNQFNQSPRGLYQEFDINGALKRTGTYDENGHLQWNNQRE
jgi:antitoxin component YwqK of YwqJK toxin-antitoxin module